MKIKTAYHIIYNFFFDASSRIFLNHKIGSYYANKSGFISTLIVNHLTYKMLTKRNCQISYHSVLGKNLQFPHPIGIVIGDGVIIGNNVKIWHQVTLGSNGKGGGRSYPIIEDNVRIFAGAKILGNVTIGEGATIGANAVVLTDVPKGKVAVGIPAKIK